MRYLFFSFAFILASGILHAQHTYVPLDADAERLIQRFEIRTGNLRNGLFTDIRPYSRASFIEKTKLLNVLSIGMMIYHIGYITNRH
jgi:hypothetical protein